MKGIDKKKDKEDDSIELEYIPVGRKVNLIREFLKVIPPQFKPTDRLGYIFVTIFVLVISVGVANAIIPALDFSFDLNSDEINAFELNIDIGLPFQFFGADEFGRIEIDAKNFFLDFFIWILIAYIIDVSINFLLSIKLKTSKEEMKKKPKEISIQPRTIAEKTAEKIMGKVISKVKAKQVKKL